MAPKVHFNQYPVSSISRPPEAGESRAITRFEDHMDVCRSCDRYFCRRGRALVDEIRSLFYRGDDGAIYSTNSSPLTKIRVEIPAYFTSAPRLFREHSPLFPKYLRAASPALSSDRLKSPTTRSSQGHRCDTASYRDWDRRPSFSNSQEVSAGRFRIVENIVVRRYRM